MSWDQGLDLFDPPTPGAATGRKCRHPRPLRVHAEDGGWTCSPCGHIASAERIKAGRRVSRAGKRIQHQRITGLGATNLAGNNKNLDGVGERFRYESKSLATAQFPGRLWDWLSGIPVGGSQAGVLIVTERPGPGRRARSFVVVSYETWRDEHGEAA